jgi:3-phenylpropionate/trans-cinnamate dioxygenase ferredoxin reductase component
MSLISRVTAKMGHVTPKQLESVVVVGNGVAGYACASALANAGVPVTMVGPGVPHDRPPLSKRALATGRLPVVADATKMTEQGIVHLDGTVVGLDIDGRTLDVELAGSGSTTLTAEKLVWATGLRYPRPPVPGMETADENSTGAGMLALVDRLRTPGQRVVVVGAGLIGTETAATLSANHQVTLVDMLDRPLARFLPVVSGHAIDMLAELGVRFLGEVRIDAADTDGSGYVIRTSTHGELPCDVIVSAAGFRTSLPEVLVDDPRALAMPADETLRVIGREQLWACGDCVTFPHPRYGRIGIPHWDHAKWSGAHVAKSILGSTEPYVREPYFFSDIGRLRIQQVGLAAHAVDWTQENGLHIGRDADGQPACVLLLNAPARLREARDLVASAA